MFCSAPLSGIEILSTETLNIGINEATEAKRCLNQFSSS